MQNDTVTFAYRDRADGNKAKAMTLAATEFIRRFLLHVLPDGFVRIRYFGFLAHRCKPGCVKRIRALIDPDAKPEKKLDETTVEMMLRITGIDITKCPNCGHRQLLVHPLVKLSTAIA